MSGSFGNTNHLKTPQPQFYTLITIRFTTVQKSLSRPAAEALPCCEGKDVVPVPSRPAGGKSEVTCVF